MYGFHYFRFFFFSINRFSESSHTRSCVPVDCGENMTLPKIISDLTEFTKMLARKKCLF